MLEVDPAGLERDCDQLWAEIGEKEDWKKARGLQISPERQREMAQVAETHREEELEEFLCMVKPDRKWVERTVLHAWLKRRLENGLSSRGANAHKDMVRRCWGSSCASVPCPGKARRDCRARGAGVSAWTGAKSAE